MDKYFLEELTDFRKEATANLICFMKDKGKKINLDNPNEHIKLFAMYLGSMTSILQTDFKLCVTEHLSEKDDCFIYRVIIKKNDPYEESSS